MTGADALLDALVAQGVEYIFGNPGSTELPLIDALAASGRPRFVLGLTEAAATGMADGYAQASGRLGVVLVHVQPGMANALAGVLNAARARVPMLVIVGQQVSAMLAGAPFLGGDVVGMARPLARFAAEVTDPADLGALLHQAVRAALGPPAGPAVLSVPLDVQAGAAATLAPLPLAPRGMAPPDPVALDDAAGLLASARNPILLAGDGVAESGAGEVLATLAVRLGAPILGEPFGARLPMHTGDPAWRGPMPRFASAIRQTLDRHDVVVALGMPVFRLFGWSPGSCMPDGAVLIHADVDPDEIGRMHVPAVGMVADPAAVIAGLRERLGPPDHAARTRRGQVVAATLAQVRSERSALGRRVQGTPDAITGAALCAAIAAAVTPDDLVVDEGLTATRDLRVALGPRAPGTWLGHRGSALGWGLPAAVGARIANPSRRVLCIQGDGSLMFGAHALWTSAAHDAPVALVVADNRGYEILRAGLEGLTGQAQGSWPGVSMASPPIDIAALGRAFGASAQRVDAPCDLPDALDDLLRRSEDGPAILVAGVVGITPPVGGPLDGAPGVSSPRT